MLSFWLMLLISFIIPLHPISLLHTTQCTYTTRTDSILGLSSVRVRINVNGVSKTKRVTNHTRILVQWWCMRICACSGFLLSGGSGGCFDGILADRTNLKMCTFCMNIMMNIVGHHFQKINFTYTWEPALFFTPGVVWRRFCQLEMMPCGFCAH